MSDSLKLDIDSKGNPVATFTAGPVTQGDEGLDGVMASLSGKEINVIYPPAPLIGIKGDGVIDDTTVFTNLINSAINNYWTLRIPSNVIIKVTSSLPMIDSNKMAIVGSKGAIIDYSAMTSGTLFTIASPSTLQGNDAALFGVILKGSTNTGCTSIGVALGDSTNSTSSGALSSQGLVLQHLKFIGGGTQLKHYANVWCVDTQHCSFTQAVTKSVDTGGFANSGELINFDHCIFHNSNTDAIYTAGGVNLNFTRCSFDYLGRAINIQGGNTTVSYDNCYFEGNDANLPSGCAEYFLIHSPSGDVVFQITNSVFVSLFSPVNRPQWINNTGGNVQRIVVKDSFFNTSQDNGLVALTNNVDGCAFKNIQSYDKGSTPILLTEKASNNYSGSFWAGLNGWTTLSGTAPTVDSSVYNSPSQSIKWVGTGGTPVSASFVSETIPCKIGDIPIFSIMYNLSAYTSGSVVVNVDYLDGSGNVITSLLGSDASLSTVGGWNRIAKCPTGQRFPISGVVNARLRFTVTSLVGTINIDDAFLWIT